MLDLILLMFSRSGLAFVSFIAGCGFLGTAFSDNRHLNDVMVRGVEARALVALDGAKTKYIELSRHVTLTWLDQQRRPHVSRVKVSEAWFQSTIGKKRTEPVAIRYVDTPKSKPVVLADVSFLQQEIWENVMYGVGCFVLSAFMVLWIVGSNFGRGSRTGRTT